MKQYSFYTRNFALHTSQRELKDLAIAWLLVSIAFAIVRSTELSSIFSAEFITLIIISAITVGLGFLLHELAHKIVAQRYHCWAEFRADITMLVVALLMSVLGFVFVAPGAVVIYGHVNERQNGIISMAGPLTNIVLAIIFAPLLLMHIPSPILSEIVHFGFLVNAWLGLFNMIPFMNFDGAKILRWNKAVYFSMVAVSALMVFLYFMRG